MFHLSFPIRGLALVAALTLMFGLAAPAAAQGAKPSKSETSAATGQSLPEPSASARELFSRNKERLLQVRVLLASASEQSSLGSGFVVRDDGDKGAWVLTNYHVISSIAVDPQKYRIELRGANNRQVKAELAAIDVIHDLAVLRTEAAPNTPPWSVFALRDTPITQGAKVFSLGNPLELGFLISEGIYNGQVESRIYEQMLFSGALNSGMSGGPAIDESSRVVGINVATRRDGELLSFLVPVRYARELLTRAEGVKPRNEWRTEIARQLGLHQDFVLSKLLRTDQGAATGFSKQNLAGRDVPTIDGELTKCWARGLEGEKLRYQRDSLNCDLHSDLFVRNSLYTGSISLQHTVLRNTKLATPQFLNLGSSQGSLGAGAWRNSEVTRSECHDNYVSAAQHIFHVSVCVRAYRKFDGLYDYNLQAVQIDDARERQSSTLQLRGFSFVNAQRIAQLFLERLQ